MDRGGELHDGRPAAHEIAAREHFGIAEQACRVRARSGTDHTASVRQPVGRMSHPKRRGGLSSRPTAVQDPLHLASVFRKSGELREFRGR
jgi:hypothetical protein